MESPTEDLSLDDYSPMEDSPIEDSAPEDSPVEDSPPPSPKQKPIMRCISQQHFELLEQTIKTIYSDETKAKSLPTTPADDMQRSFPSQENIFMEPHPDYLLDENSDSYYGDDTDYHPANGGMDGDDVLIQPRKLINPCLQSKERRDLHKELLFNYKHGKNVLKKPELEKVLQQRKEAQRVKQWDDQKCLNKKTHLELMLEERKNRLSQEEDKVDKLKHASMELENRPEYLKVHAKIHAKVAANVNKLE